MTITRVDRGRGHSYKLDGEKAPGVTTIIGDGCPKPALVTWAAGVVGELVADGLTEKGGHFLADELMANLREISAKRERPLPEKFSRVKVADALKYLPYAERDAAANRGSEVHKIAEQLAQGEKVAVPDPIKGHVDAYLRFREEWEPYDELVEFVIANRTHRYVGTGDLLARFPALGDGLWLTDLKTNRSGPFGETALQLAAYRYAEVMLDPEGNEIPMPEVEGCLVLWLRADGYDLYPFEAGPAEFRQFLYVQQVAWFAKERSREVKGAALAPPARAEATA